MLVLDTECGTVIEVYGHVADKLYSALTHFLSELYINPWLFCTIVTISNI